MSNIKHTISGNNFHGNYSVTLIGPKDGFTLSASQLRKYRKELCGMSDCKCGGGYGTGLDSGSPHIELDYNSRTGEDIAKLVPADTTHPYAE